MVERYGAAMERDCRRGLLEKLTLTLRYWVIGKQGDVMDQWRKPEIIRDGGGYAERRRAEVR